MRKRMTLTISLLVLVMVFSGCGQQTESPVPEASLTHVRLPMGYIPNVQYAPFYVGVEKGFFRDAGIEIEFDYSYETDGMALVGSNELQFSLASGEQILLARAEGLPVVYVMSWYADYPVAIASLAEDEIQSPEDLAGKKVGLPGLFGASYVGFRALLGAGGLSEGDLTLDSIGFNQVEAFAAGQEDAVVVYVANEPTQLRAMGYDIDVMRVSDYVQLASNGLVTNETTIAENPDLVRRMVQATLRGITYTIKNNLEAYEICEIHVEGLTEADRTVQMQVLAESIALYQNDPPGHTDSAAWENMQNVLLDMGLMTEAIDIQEAFTNDFIE
jgi:NitT/TauT family transport system substrate-binding protein